MNCAILIDRKIYPATIAQWATWRDSSHDRIVDQHTIGEVFISTVFLGITREPAESKPNWFETMIFGGAYHGATFHCKDYGAAERMHKYAIDLIFGGRDYVPLITHVITS